MTVTSSMIAQVSPYTVSDAGDFTTTLFTFYSPIAKAKLDKEDPGLDTVTYDYCHALLIVYFYEVKRKATNVKSKSIGGVSMSYENPGGVYLAQYQQTLSDFKAATALPSQGVARSDNEMTELRLDNGDVPSYEDDEGS